MELIIEKQTDQTQRHQLNDPNSELPSEELQMIRLYEATCFAVLKYLQDDENMLDTFQSGLNVKSFLLNALGYDKDLELAVKGALNRIGKNLEDLYMLE